MRVTVDVGGLDLKNVCWYGAVRVNVHVLVDDGLWQATACTRGRTDTPAGEKKKKTVLCSKSSHAIH